MFNLISESWIPVKRGTTEKTEFIAPWQITAPPELNPILTLAAQRPDFNGALIQFLIGLVQTTYPPSDPQDWRKKFNKPPSPDELKSAFGRYAHTFNLDGDGPRFMQDLDLSEKDGEINQIDHLLMEMPGAQTIDKNTDHFLKRDTVKQLCLPCCAMALFTLQTNAPAGGKGHRTSIRGGGPLTTIVLGRTLWETIWLNVISADEFSRYGNSAVKADPDCFPWMDHTRTSEKKGSETTSQHVNPVQMFWGMPRRIRLQYENGEREILCDLCGTVTSRYAIKYYDKSYGINYKEGWRHTLTPHSVDEKNGDFLPKHGQSGGISYRNWLGLVQSDADKKSKNLPAVVVDTFRNDRQDKLPQHTMIPFRLWAFGYDMDNMKACGWYEGTMPLIHVSVDIKPEYEINVSRLIKTANLVAFNVRACIRKALFKPNATVSGDLSFIDSEFWQDTEPAFYQMLGELKVDLQTKQKIQDLKLRWLAILSREGEVLFDRYSQSNLISVADPKRIALARRDFKIYSSPYNKKIIELLDLPQPEKQSKSSGAGKNKTERREK